MPTANPPEPTAAELELKRRGRRRLIGALTVGVLAIVVLPMIFDSEPRRKQAARQEIEVRIPSKDGQPPLPTPVAPPIEAAQKDVGKAPATAAVGMPGKTDTKADPKTLSTAEVAPVKVTAAESDKLGKAQAESAAVAPTKLLPAKSDAKADVAAVAGAAVAKAPTSTAALAGFVIQLGAYKDADNAKALVARMKEAKLPVFTDVLPVKTGTVTRVRVGPFSTKEKADGALAQVKLAGVDGKVVALP